jgi:DNA-directed RNA polymerase specialized sigma subunit
MIKFIKKNHDSHKVNTPKFESLPVSGISEKRNKKSSNFFDSDVVHGRNLYYYEDEDIQNYLKDHDEISKKVILMKMKGQTQKQIKKELNISENEIRSILKKIKNELIGNA